MAAGNPRDQRIDLDRLRNLSDGVFAIVFTLLVLNLHVPNLDQIDSDRALARALTRLWPVYLGYSLSFLVIGVYWLVHTRFVRRIVRSNRRVLVSNLIFLFWLSIVPFTTMVSTSTPNLPLSWAVYSANITLIGLSLIGIWRKAVVKNCVDPHVTPLYGRYIALRGWTAVVVFSISGPLAFWRMDVARVLPLLIPALSLGVRRYYRPRLQHEWDLIQAREDEDTMLS